eukprot:scaffold3084_cov144-Cylindrotheca_fusiformis.AAC.16
MQRVIRRNRKILNYARYEKQSSTRTDKKVRRGKNLCSVFGVCIVVTVILLAFRETRTSKSGIQSPLQKLSTTIDSPALPKSKTNTTLVECRIVTPNWINTGAPNGVWRITVYNDAPCAPVFLSLVVGGYYNDVYLFRVIQGFVAQWGFRPVAPSAGGWKTQKRHEDQKAKTYTGNLSNIRGTVTMIKGDLPQVFLNLGNNRRLDKDNTIPFGRIDGRGMEIAAKLYTGYKPGQGQIPAIKNGTAPTLFPKMSKVERCNVAQET